MCAEDLSISLTISGDTAMLLLLDMLLLLLPWIGTLNELLSIDHGLSVLYWEVT